MQLKLLEGALDISEYTDKVDIASDSFGWRLGGKSSTMRTELTDVLSLVSGLLVAGNKSSKSKSKSYECSIANKLGYNSLYIYTYIVCNKSFKDNEGFFQCVFEIGRRYKISNCDKLRTTYGKLLHILQVFSISNHINIYVGVLQHAHDSYMYI